MACRHLLSSSQGFLAETGAAPALRGYRGSERRGGVIGAEGNG